MFHCAVRMRSAAACRFGSSPASGLSHAGFAVVAAMLPFLKLMLGSRKQISF